MIKVKPILVNNLFSKLNRELLKLLRGLDDKDWHNKTACPRWSVKDIVQHLLKDDIGVLSRKRDNFRNPHTTDKKFNNNTDLVSYVNRKNQDWVDISKSISPQLLIELLELTGSLIQDYYKKANPYKIESRVSWISDKKLPNWMDIAREYTERWLHQAHIREAVKKPLLDSFELFHPFIQSYMLALPLTYKDVKPDAGATINIKVNGEAGGNWILKKSLNGWMLTEEKESKSSITKITIEQDTLWRLFSKGLNLKKAKKIVEIKGNIKLGSYLFNTISLIA
jgi:hypothetical protein